MCPILQTIQESFTIIGAAQTTAEVKDGIVILQGQGVQKFLQLLESITDLFGIALMGFSIGLI